MPSRSSYPGSGKYQVDVRYDLRIPTADADVSLSADVYLPVDAGPAPVLISAYPYRKDFLGPRLAPLMSWFATHGYVNVLVDLRGTGSSDGRYIEFDVGERHDLVNAIQWAAAQPWCDGNVGMWGHSYGAWTTMSAASRQPEPLKAILPIQAPTDPERHVVHYDGSRGGLHMTHRAANMLALQLLPPLHNPGGVDEQRRWYKRLHDTDPILLDFARYGPGDPVWRERAIDASTITTPALCIGGWNDLHCEGITRAYEQMSGPKKLLMGPWEHALPYASTAEPIDFPSIALRWWDHWLRGIDTGVMEEPPVTVYIPGDKPAWRGFRAWPPTKNELRLTTRADLTLVAPTADTATSTEMIAEYQPDPTAGALSGRWATVYNTTAPLPDQHDDDMRGLCTTTDPLPHDVCVLGRPEVSVTLASDGVTPPPVERLVIRLTDVDPQGRSTFITAGILCPPDPGHKHQVELRPAAHTIPAGHRLRIVLSDSNFPRLTPLMNPKPIPVAGIDVSIPVLNREDGTAAEVPPATTTADTLLAVRPDAASSPPSFTVTRNHTNDSAQVTFGTAGVGPQSSTYDVRAFVPKSDPSGFVINGTSHHRIRTNTSEEIAVTATVRYTQFTLSARGEITIDGTTTYSKTWNTPL